MTQQEMIRKPRVEQRVEVYAGTPREVAEEVNDRVAWLMDQQRWGEGQVSVTAAEEKVVATLHFIEIMAVDLIDPRTGATVRSETPGGLQLVQG